MTKLYAAITAVDLTNELNPVYAFDLTDSDEDGMISVSDKISLAHATYLVDHELPAVCRTAYQKMVNAIATCDHHLLVGSEFES